MLIGRSGRVGTPFEKEASLAVAEVVPVDGSRWPAADNAWPGWPPTGGCSCAPGDTPAPTDNDDTGSNSANAQSLGINSDCSFLVHTAPADEIPWPAPVPGCVLALDVGRTAADWRRRYSLSHGVFGSTHCGVFQIGFPGTLCCFCATCSPCFGCAPVVLGRLAVTVAILRRDEGG